MRKIAKAVSTVLIIVSAAAFLFLAIGPRVLGYQTSTMLTGSMSPEINPGDVVVTVPVPIDSIQAGDVITYQIPLEDRRIETHRVVEVLRDEENRLAVRTKGDANNAVDPWTAVLQGEHAYRKVAVVPYLGTVIRTLREPAVRNVLLYGAPALLVIGVLNMIWRKPKTKPASSAEDNSQEATA